MGVSTIVFCLGACGKIGALVGKVGVGEGEETSCLKYSRNCDNWSLARRAVLMQGFQAQLIRLATAF
jgi:hypothetical protein